MAANPSQVFTQAPALTGKMTQTQKLSAQMLHSVKILECPSTELENVLQELVNTNPLLELSGTSDPLSLEEAAVNADAEKEKDHDGTFPEEDSPGNFAEEKKYENSDPDKVFSSEENGTAPKREQEWDEYLEDLAREPSEWDSDFFSNTPYDETSADKKEYFFNSLTQKVSLKDFLMEQLSFSDAPSDIKRGAEYIIGSLEKNGFFTDELSDIAQMANITLSETEKALALVQSFDPPGVAARDLSDCLLLQMHRKKIRNHNLEKLIKDHLEDLGKNRLPVIAAAMKISMEKLGVLIEELRKLNPRPAGNYTTETVKIIVPDVIVEETEGEFKVTLNDRMTPKLYFSHAYDDIIKDPALSPEDKAYFKEKTAEGENAIFELEHRSSTILRIATLIVSEQYEFLKHGGSTLKPFTMHQAADKLGLDDSTISRGCNEKHMLTPRGIFEFKYFFTTGYTASSGEETSRLSIMEMIREMIADEDPSKPLSDDTLSRMLKEKGYDVARRTVMKYRESMNIPSSQGRRKHL